MTASRSSASRMKHHRESSRQGTRCVTVEVSQSERDALVGRSYLSEEDRDNGTAIKKAIEGVLSDIVSAVTRARLDSHVPTDEVGESRRN
jgi:hypothetical protein